jgi:hypothetical protein
MKKEKNGNVSRRIADKTDGLIILIMVLSQYQLVYRIRTDYRTDDRQIG